MDVETIIAILTAGFAAVTSVASFTLNFVQNRRASTQKIILANRIKYLDEIREGFTDFISLAHPQAIEAAKSNSEILKNFSSNLFTGYGKIKTYIKPFYSIDAALLAALDDTYACILSMLNGTETDGAKLDALRNVLEDKYLKYDWAYWKYIQRQKDGNFLNSDDSFDKIYEQFVSDIDNHKL